MTRSTISSSPIPRSPLSLWSLSLSVWLLCVTFACANLLDQIEHCELDCASTTVGGLNVVGNCEPKCSQGLTIPSQIEKQGQDAIKRYLDSFFSNALLGGDSTETGQNREARPVSYAVKPDSKTQIKDEGERNMDADKSAFEPPKESGEEHKLTIPSEIQNEGQDAIKSYLDNLFSNALLGSDSTETGENHETHPDSYAIESDTETQTHEGDRNMDAHKSSYKLPKKPREEQLLDGDIAVNVNLEIVGDGEYVLKIKRMNNPSSTDEDELERAKNMAQNGAMLLHYGEILQDMGEKLLAQSQASIYSVFKMPAPPKLMSDQ